MHTMVVPVSVRELMRTDHRTLHPSTSVEQAATELRETDLGSLIVAVDNVPTGIVVESDIVDTVVSDNDLSATVVESVMRPDPVTVDGDASLREAATRLQTNDTTLLPVVVDGELAGVVTTADVTSFYPRRTAPAQADGGFTAMEPGTNGTAYDVPDWEFSDDGAHPETVEVGETFRFAKRISAADVEAFAQASGDTNRLHLSEEFAAGSRFGRPIAHGMLVASVISATLARLPGTVIYLSQTTEFVAPVDIGDRVSANVTAVDALVNDRWRLETTVLDSNGEPVVEGEAVVLVESETNTTE